MRDLVTEPQDLRDKPILLLDEFLAGYHEEYPQADVDRELLLLFTAVNALRSLARVLPVLAEDPRSAGNLTARATPGEAAPTLLRTVVERYAQRQREIAANLALLLG